MYIKHKTITMKRIYLLLLGLVIFGYYANAQNYIVDPTNDTIDISVTWDYDTVFMDTTLFILDDVVLTIEPGTQIIFSDFYSIEVEGTIVSEGTETDSIYYTVTDTTGFYNDFDHLGWAGIVFDNNSGSMDDNDASSFAYCSFSYSKRTGSGGVIFANHYDDLVITNCYFEYNYSSGSGGAIQFYYLDGGFVNNCTFLNNWSNSYGGAIDLYECTGISVIKNSYFEGNYAEGRGGAIKAGGYYTTQITSVPLKSKNVL